jgi:hypothetical protein
VANAKSKSPAAAPSSAPSPAPKGRRGEADSEHYHPELGSKPTKSAPPPRIEPQPPFFFSHHPHRYTVMQAQVIPQLGKFKLQAGLNGVEQEPKSGRAIPGPALEKARSDGIVIVPHDVEGAGTTYLRKPKGTSDVVISRFEKVYPGSNQIDCDEVEYVKFCRKLLADAIVPQPPIFVLERMEASVQKQIDELAEKRGVEGLVKRLTGDRDAIRRELAEQRRQAEAAETEPVEIEPPVDPGAVQ